MHDKSGPRSILWAEIVIKATGLPRPAPAPPPQIMDTPRPDQVRRAQPQAEAATEEDSLELMEMILGALGGCLALPLPMPTAAVCTGKWRSSVCLPRAGAQPIRPPVTCPGLRHALYCCRLMRTAVAMGAPQAATRWAWAAASRTRGRARSGRR